MRAPGAAEATSADLAERLRPYPLFHKEREARLKDLVACQTAAAEIDHPWAQQAAVLFAEAAERAARDGLRNSLLGAAIDSPEMSLRLGGRALGPMCWTGPRALAEDANGEVFPVLSEAALEGLTQLGLDHDAARVHVLGARNAWKERRG